jgi:hypothetical protein
MQAHLMGSTIDYNSNHLKLQRKFHTLDLIWKVYCTIKSVRCT